MGDIFCLPEENSNIEIIFEKFITAHLSLNFTIEQEVDNTYVYPKRPEKESYQRSVYLQPV